ncbi:hypothetical protein B0H10DRAFT_2237186 [Mycena sp. CBHHK59/15]|nr:hypothetical protein B0H10DRAFT_2237186 [Mycena sp. CBHHK59/15]
MPPPTGRELAVAQLQASLDSSMFDQMRRFHEEEEEEDKSDEDPLHAKHISTACLLRASGPSHHSQLPLQCTAGSCLLVHLCQSSDLRALTKDKKAPTVTTNLVLPSDIPPGDFFSRVQATMNVDPATAVLGWKESAERRKDPYHRLSSAEDLAEAIKPPHGAYLSQLSHPNTAQGVVTTLDDEHVIFG